MRYRWWLGPISGWVLTLAPGAAGGQAPGPEPGTAPGTLTLTEAVALALESHPAIGQARAHRQVATARLKQAQAGRLPWLTTQASLARHQEPMVVAPLHGFDPTNPPAFDRNLLQGSLTFGYTLFDGGARGAKNRQAEAGEEAAEAAVLGSGMDIAFQVSSAYLAVLSGEEVLGAVQSQKTALGSELGRVRQFLEQGKAARVDLLRVEAALSRAEASEISARATLEVSRSRLARLTGLKVEDLEGRSLSEVVPRSAGLPSREEVLAFAQSVNPQISQARNLLASAMEGVREANATWYPKVEAGGRYADFGTLDGGHVQEWQGLLQISYPLFSGGAIQGDRERALAEERRAVEAVRMAEMAVADQAETALASVREAQALREALDLATTQSEEVARIEALALDAGVGVQTDFLRAEAELFQARAALSQARHGETLAWIRLARATGELTLRWIEENMEAVK